MLPLLLASVIRCAWGAVRGARIEHAAHHRNLADSRLRNVFRSYTTERNTADEVRAGTMAGFLIRQYRIVSGRLEAEQLRATRQALAVQGIGDALTAVGTAATWGVLVLLVATGRLELAAAGTAALAVRTSGAALATTVRAGPGSSAPRCPWTTGPGSWPWPSRGRPAVVQPGSPRMDRR